MFRYSPIMKRQATLPKDEPEPKRIKTRLQIVDPNAFSPLYTPTWTAKNPKTPQELLYSFARAWHGGSTLFDGLVCYPFVVHIYGIQVYGRNPLDKEPIIQLEWSDMGMFHFLFILTNIADSTATNLLNVILACRSENLFAEYSPDMSHVEIQSQAISKAYKFEIATHYAHESYHKSLTDQVLLPRHQSEIIQAAVQFTYDREEKDEASCFEIFICSFIPLVVCAASDARDIFEDMQEVIEIDESEFEKGIEDRKQLIFEASTVEPQEYFNYQ